MKRRLKILAFGFLSLLMASCVPAHQNTPEKINIKGSETELFLIKRYAEAYNYTFKNANIIVDGGGTEAGIQALVNGKAEIANASRLIKSSEEAAIDSKGIEVKQVIIAVNTIAIIVHPSIRLNNISVEALKQIYSGKIKNWEMLGGPNKPLHAYGRKPGSGTHDFMLHRLNLTEYSPSTREFETYEDILNSVKNDSCGIAYISSAFVKQNVPSYARSVFVLNVYSDTQDSYSPYDEKAIEEGNYAFIRPLLQYYNASSNNPAINKFIKFELSKECQLVLRLSGYYPINYYHKQINEYKGIALLN